MPRKRKPRAGSMQFWPRVRAKRHYARVRSYKDSETAVVKGFAGYKVGMTHIQFNDPRKNSPTKGEIVNFPVTVVECPPIKVYGVRFYKKGNKGLEVATEIVTKADKELSRKIPATKKEGKLDLIKPEEYLEARLLVYTQPKLTGIGKKKPEIFELPIGGEIETQISYAKEVLGKEIKIEDIFKAGQQVDIAGITTGKGFSGAIKRFGIHRTRHKSEKGIRTAGSLGGWKGQGHFMYRVPAPGKMGFHQRREFNKLILKIGNNPEEINPKGGFVKYGNVKNTYILLKGGVVGPSNRIVRFNIATRPNDKYEGFAPDIKYVSLESKQGN